MTILSVAYFDSSTVTPTAVADNQTPVTSFVSATQPGTMLGEPVSSSTTWLDESQFQAANLCTASAITFIREREPLRHRADNPVLHLFSGPIVVE